MRVILVTGGARSGKSAFAQRLAQQAGGDAVTFVATATATDAEMETRIAAHRAERPAAWRTVEAPRTAGQAIALAQTDAVLLDCLTLLVSNTLLAHADEGEAATHAAVRAEVDVLLEAAGRRAGTLVVVTNEVGSGIVPAHALGRWFRDTAGWTNQRVASVADEVYLLVAGVPLRIRGAP